MAKRTRGADDGNRASKTRPGTGAGNLLQKAKTLFDEQSYQAARDTLGEIEAGTPNYLAARHLFARTYLSEKDYPEFLDVCRKLVTEFPNNPQCYHLCGVAHSQLHQLEKAEQAFRTALSLNPNDLPSAENLGIILDINGWKRESYFQLLQVLQKTGKLGRVGYLALTRNALLIGDKRTAYNAVRHVLGNTPNDPVFLHQDALIAFAHNDFDVGNQILESSLQRHPNSPELIMDSGVYNLSSGNLDDAAKSFRKVIQIDPHHSRAHYALADMGGGAGNGGEDDRVQRLSLMHNGIRKPEIPYIKQVELGFAAGKVLDSQQRYDEAFKCYDEANKKIWARLPREAADIEQEFERTKHVYDSSFFSRAGVANPEAGAGMVYIVGMPRSGTTLLEQMLSRLPNVIAGGEPAELESIKGQLPKLLSRTGQYPEVLVDVSNEEFRRLSDKFMTQYRSEIDVGYWRTNKDMELYFHLGLIAVLFPAARIIHCRRNPLDTCVSAYFQFFKLYRIQHSFDLVTLARYYRAYVDLMDYWKNILPMNVLDFRYEDLTSDPEPAIRRVAEFCGMEWSDDCLDFKQSGSLIKTASIWQVRQGLNQKSVNRWKRYESHLAPLIDALGDLAES